MARLTIQVLTFKNSANYININNSLQKQPENVQED